MNYQNMQAQQGITANLPPAVLPLTVLERHILMDLIAQALPPAESRERFDALVALILKIRGEHP
jgi:hypothetical protein